MFLFLPKCRNFSIIDEPVHAEYLVYIYELFIRDVRMVFLCFLLAIYPTDLKNQTATHLPQPVQHRCYQRVKRSSDGERTLTFLASCTAILINISLRIVSARHFNFPKCIELFHLIICINEFKIMLVNARLRFNLLI